MDFRPKLLAIGTVCLYLFIGYVLIALFMYFLQETFIFFPRTITEERWEQISDKNAGELLSIPTTDNQTLRGWFLPSGHAGPRPTVLFFGGNAMSLDYFADDVEPLRERGANMVLVDYRGYGLSTGKPSTASMQIDSEYIYDAIASRSDVDTDRIFVWGVSIGTGVATHLASVREVSGVILFSPFTSMEDVAKETYPFLPINLLLRHRLNSFALAPKIKDRALFIHGSEDTMIAPAHSEKLSRAWGGEQKLVILEKRDHNNLFADERAWEEVLNFVGR